ncbi:MAG TPA: sulfatase [Polyangiaceae bacterium]|nr:sulfatase [Polyangiaceae bacterium]
MTKHWPLALLLAACGTDPSGGHTAPPAVGGGGDTGGQPPQSAGSSAGALTAGSGGSGGVAGSTTGGTPSSAGTEAGGAGGTAPELPARPNIVVILTDDQGWNATSVQMLAGRADSKSDFYETANMERLAEMGMTFSAGYAAPNCSPSRLSLLTGKSPARLKMTDIIGRTKGTEYLGHPILPPGHVDNVAGRIQAIPSGEQTIAELIKAHDPEYVTAHFGKWHLAGEGPALHGFDQSDGETSNETGNVGGDDPKLVFSLAEKAETFIKERAAADQPFYLQVSQYAVHEDTFALASTIAKYEAKTPGTVHSDAEFAAMTEHLDTSIGRILDALGDPNGDGDSSDSVLASTYVVLLADNGAVDAISDNVPLAEGKATTYEGGIRVPFLVAGPAIAGSSRSDIPVSEFDLLPTIAEWVGAVPAATALDGGSFASLTRGEVGFVQGRETGLVFHFPHYQVAKGAKPMSSVRDGNYKLDHFYETGKDQLFDLSVDLGEENDLAGAKPKMVRELRRKLRDYLRDVDAPMPRLNPEFYTGSAPDVDQDGLNDDWEFRELLTTAYSGSDDPDGDGKDNESELAQGTDPLP